MRALILRGEACSRPAQASPVMVRPGSENGDVLKRNSLMRRNGHRHLRLDLERDLRHAKALMP